jgi:iron complex transport system permease protein
VNHALVMRPRALAPVLISVLSLVMLAALAVGSSGLLDSASSTWADIATLRGQRVLGAALVGGALGVAGTLMQTLLANDLADPYVLGLSGGASLGAVLSLTLVPALAPGFLAAGAALAAALWVVHMSRNRSPADTLLAGVVLGAVLAAGTGIVLTLVPHASFARSANHWLFGGLGSPRSIDLCVLGTALALAFVWAERRASSLDRMALGRDVAIVLGLDVSHFERQLLAVAVLLTSLSVALGGLIGFVGLAAPHLARKLVGGKHARLVPMSLWIGAISLVVADAAARTAFAPRELPVGLLTAAVLGPVLLWLRGRR